MPPLEPLSPGTFLPPGDFVPLRTADGSFTLDSPALGEHYHSVNGAVTESRHVYIRNGLGAVPKTAVDILEVGLGTGLNALLTWMAADEQGLRVDYCALEPFPVDPRLHRALGHPDAVGEPRRGPAFARMMDAAEGTVVAPSPAFRFRRSAEAVQRLGAEGAYDLVYFDAFAPDIQPEMWTTAVFARLRRAMRPGAVLVTYCAKGSARRAMEAAGLWVERLPGPPGKRQMLRARRP